MHVSQGTGPGLMACMRPNEEEAASQHTDSLDRPRLAASAKRPDQPGTTAGAGDRETLDLPVTSARSAGDSHPAHAADDADQPGVVRRNENPTTDPPLFPSQPSDSSFFGIAELDADLDSVAEARRLLED